EPATLEALGKHPFLHDLGEPLRVRLAGGAREFTAAPGEFLAREGQSAVAFYLIQTGQVAIGMHLGNRRAVPIQSLRPGRVVGWSWLLPPYRWAFDARAADPVHGLTFDGAWLREQCDQDHELGYELVKRLMAVVAGRLAATRVQQLDIYR